MGKSQLGEARLLRSGQVGDLLGVTVWTVHNMVRDGRLRPVEKLEGRTGGYLFTRAEIERCLAERAKAAEPAKDGAA